MQGSADYLDLLDGIATILAETEPINADQWVVLDGAYEQFMDTTGNPGMLRNGALIFLATQCLRLWADLQHLSFADTIATAKDLHIRKNAGYAGASETGDPWYNFRQAERLGVSAVQGVYVRMTDKYSRIRSLRQDAANDQVGESLADTLLDLAAYALIAYCLLHEVAVVTGPIQ